uniref:Uncharacterized protein n=1 Tax=Lepeophtheirus salmonis TaxID=72036 RepID=A0A0K2V5Z9_LEPSM
MLIFVMYFILPFLFLFSCMFFSVLKYCVLRSINSLVLCK